MFEFICVLKNIEIWTISLVEPKSIVKRNSGCHIPAMCKLDLGQKLTTYNLGQKSKEIKQNWIGTENFYNCSCVIFDGCCKSYIHGTKTEH